MSPLRTTGLALSVVVVVAAVAAVISNRSDGDPGTDRAGRSTTTAGPTTAPTAPTSVPRCSGVPMRSGQKDIDAAPPGTTFCLSGTHNWTLTPKSGDRFVGPAILDGRNTTTTGFLGNGTSNVTLANLEIRNYRAGDQEAAISAHGTTGWVLRNLQVHDNGTADGGTGANIGVDSHIIGGRYYNNRTLGIGGGGGADGWIIDGAEIDHNNFTNNDYTKRNTSCGYEGGGVKWTADNATVTNSKIHDNACKGLWADLNADNAKIVDNNVYGNWDEGIFIEISSGAVVTGNTVSLNGLKNDNGSGSGCPWLWGGGITLASSGHAEVARNTLSGNCNGITGTQQTRTEGKPGLLEYLSIHDNLIVGPGGKTGVAADNGANLTTRSIVFANNAFDDTTFCGLGDCGAG
jgi:parallel beta-helix repeat protein